MKSPLFQRTYAHYPWLFLCLGLAVALLASAALWNVDPLLALPLWLGYLIARDHL